MNSTFARDKPGPQLIPTANVTFIHHFLYGELANPGKLPPILGQIVWALVSSNKEIASPRRTRFGSDPPGNPTGRQ